jgi:hypothetical protein
MSQSLDGIDAVGEREEVDDLIIGDGVAALAVTTEPIESPTELSLVETDEPTVADSSRCRSSAEFACLWRET